jgi:hypothetical protein
LHVWTLMMLGLAYQLNGDAPQAITCHEQVVYHDECQALTLEALGPNRYHEAHQYGASLRFDPAVAYALEEPSVDHSTDADHTGRPELSGQRRVTISRRASLECPVVDIGTPQCRRRCECFQHRHRHRLRGESRAADFSPSQVFDHHLTV